MHIDRASGLLNAARYLPSPNCDPRPLGVSIDLIVIHGISLPPGTFGGAWIDALFTNTLDPNAHPYFAQIAALRVSAHVLIRRNGVITQYVPFTLRAWHAGTSAYAGRSACNDFSIGIELEGADTIPYTDAQYVALAALINTLWDTYPELQRRHLAAHSEIAPGRKTDPGPAFDWGYLRRLLQWNERCQAVRISE